MLVADSKIGRDAARRLAILLQFGGPTGQRHTDQVTSVARRLQEALLHVTVSNKAQR